MFNFFCSLFLALAIMGTLGGQLLSAAHRNAQLPRITSASQQVAIERTTRVMQSLPSLPKHTDL
jgi:hypothetical protein